MGAAIAHSAFHELSDNCISHCGSDHGNEHNDNHGSGSEPHYHVCCHFPCADRVTNSLVLRMGFECVLVKIAADRAQAPDDPVFALDKPPLI
jgi:hypothetical protein